MDQIRLRVETRGKIRKNERKIFTDNDGLALVANLQEDEVIIVFRLDRDYIIGSRFVDFGEERCETHVFVQEIPCWNHGA